MNYYIFQSLSMWYELKTKFSDPSVKVFLNAIEDEAKRDDSYTLLEVFERLSWEEAKMWWSTIGFGEYHYKYDSWREGDSMRTGFSPRAAWFSFYIMPGYQFDKMEYLLSKLWKHKAWKACLNIKKLSDIDLKVLEEIIQFWLDDMKEKYPE